MKVLNMEKKSSWLIQNCRKHAKTQREAKSGQNCVTSNMPKELPRLTSHQRPAMLRWRQRSVAGCRKNCLVQHHLNKVQRDQENYFVSLRVSYVWVISHTNCYPWGAQINYLSTSSQRDIDITGVCWLPRWEEKNHVLWKNKDSYDPNLTEAESNGINTFE